MHFGSTFVQGLTLDHVRQFKPCVSVPAYKLPLSCLSVNNGNITIHYSPRGYELQYDFLCINNILILCLDVYY